MNKTEKSEELNLDHVDQVLESLCAPDLTKALNIFVGKRNEESLRKTILDFIVVWNKVHGIQENLLTTLLQQSRKSVSSGIFDMNGVEIEVGHIIHHHNQSQHTRCDYWDPVYLVVYNAPSFGLKWIGGGGKDGGNHSFTLRCRSGELEVVSKSIEDFKLTELGKKTIKE